MKKPEQIDVVALIPELDNMLFNLPSVGIITDPKLEKRNGGWRKHQPQARTTRDWPVTTSTICK